MAISNTFDTSNRYIKYRIVVEESGINIAANTSNVTVYVQAWRTNSGYTTDGAGTCYCGINGSSYSNSWNYRDGHAITQNSYTELFRTTVTIPHDANGAKQIWVSASISHANFSASDQGFVVTLSTIPRYATSNQSLSSKTETTIKMNWSSDSNIDYIWYSTNNGASWAGVGGVNASSGSYTISGLAANTTYNIKTRVRRRDSQLTTDSGTLAIATYDYPKPTTANNFVIGNGASVNLYNPLGRNCTLQLIGADNSVIGTYSGTYNGVVNAEFKTADAIDKQYKSIPNSVSGTYRTKVTYGSIVRNGPNGTYSVNPSLVKPSIGTVEYQDREEASLDITNDDQLIIQDVSIVRYRASEIGTQKYATINKVEVTVNNNTYQLGLEAIGDAAAGGNAAINSSSDVTATFKVTDSRGLTGTKEITITMLEYSLPSAIISLNRKNNFYDETIINVDANYSYLEGNNEINIEYRYKKTTDVNFSDTYTLQDNVSSVFSIDNDYYWNVQVTLYDKIGVTTYNLLVNKGTPIVFYDVRLRSVGINSFPNTAEDLVVNGISFYDTNSYSFFERKIGQWVDGKPIYRAVYENNGVMVVGSWGRGIPGNIYDVDTLVNAYFIDKPSKAVWNDTNVKIEENTIKYFSANWAHAYSHVVIEYTKTTD